MSFNILSRLLLLIQVNSLRPYTLDILPINSI